MKHIVAENIVIDIDGVLAEFNRPFAALLAKAANIPASTFTFTQWDWDRQAGVPDACIDHVWKSITEGEWSPAVWEFWSELQPRTGARELLHWITSHPLFYTPHFVTARNPALYNVTHEWLTRVFNLRHPRLIMSPNKDHICAGLEATYFVDDKYATCVDVHRMCGAYTVVCLLDASYNRPAHADHHLHRLSSLREFLELLKSHARGWGAVLEDY